MSLSLLPKTIHIGWGKQYTNQKALKKNLGNKMSIELLKAHIPGTLNGYIQGCALTWERPKKP